MRIRIYLAAKSSNVIITVTIAQSELQRFDGLEAQLRELSIMVVEIDSAKRFTPQPGNLLQFINLLGKCGAVYEVTRTSGVEG